MVGDIGAGHFFREDALCSQLGDEALHDVSGSGDSAGVWSIVAGHFDLRGAHCLHLNGES